MDLHSGTGNGPYLFVPIGLFIVFQCKLKKKTGHSMFDLRPNKKGVHENVTGVAM